MFDDGHVLRAVVAAQAGEIVVKDDCREPVQAGQLSIGQCALKLSALTLPSPVINDTYLGRLLRLGAPQRQTFRRRSWPAFGSIRISS